MQLVATKLTLSKQYPIWVALQMSKLIQFKGQFTTQYLQKYYESLKENILNGELACYHISIKFSFCNIEEYA